MSDFSKFRTAVSGFNRTDVVNYIESTSIEHKGDKVEHLAAGGNGRHLRRKRQIAD